MPHERTIIRRKAVEVLTSALDGVAVLDARPLPVDEKELPAVSVYTNEEPLDEDTRHSAPRWMRRRLRLRVECMVFPEAADDEDPDVAGAVDDLCLDVENALLEDETLGGELADLYLTNTEIEFPDHGHAVLGTAVLTFVAEYDTVLPRETTDESLDDFDKVDTRWDLNAEQDQADQAHDQITNIHETEPEEP